MAEVILPEWLKGRAEAPAFLNAGSAGFLKRSLANFASAMKRVYTSGDYSSRKGALQAIEPRAKLAGLFFIIIAASLAHSAIFLSGVLVLAVALSFISRVGPGPLVKRTLPAFIFTLIIVLPLAFGAVTPGKEVLDVFGASVTGEGLHNAGFFLLRVTAMVSITMLLSLTTRETDFFRGLGRFVPAFFATALFLTFRYSFVLIKIAEDSAFARKARTITGARAVESRMWFAGRAALLLKKAYGVAEEVGMAMVSRGFDGKLKTAPARALRGRDYFWLGFASFVLFLSFAA
ncbi:MAG: cobalt ECF transporter T component CbiQ [Deltaproteobacteria bacterium]|nr:cobalt ECF transporter T component CbiQ [Deltaproteobacteria bacterium]MBZ0219603.1 cobalt ECF transporter T component CbiQ [Deltaproteobacteria bacterium]